MKKFTFNIFKSLVAFAAVVSILASCEKDDKEKDKKVDNTIAKAFFEAWMASNHPDAVKSGRGIYIIDDEKGTGAEVNSTVLDNQFVMVTYTAQDLEGNITSTCDKKVAQMVGDYSSSKYYGPTIWQTGDYTLAPGLMDIISGMKVGGTRTAVIPGWLTEAKKYNSEEQYLKHCSGTNTIYTVTLCDISESIIDWEIKQIEEYKVKNMADVDSTSYGFYYHTLIEPVSKTSFQKDTTIYVNYIGRLLNGNVFDTTIADTAKVYGIYDASRTYSPVKISMNEEYSKVTMGSDNSEVVSGFAHGLWMLHPYETGRCAFISNFGYSSTGSSSTIPAYAPLVFDLQVVDKN